MSEGQLDLIRLVADAGESPLPTGSTGDLVTTFIQLGRSMTRRRGVFNALGVVVAAGAAGSTIGEELETRYSVEAHGQIREQRVLHRQTIGTTAAQAVRAHSVAEDAQYASGKTFTLSTADVTPASLKIAAQSFSMGKKATDTWSCLLMGKQEEVVRKNIRPVFTI